MLGLDRRTLQIAWTLLLFCGFCWTIYEVHRVLIIFTLALFFAHLLGPVIEFVERFAGNRFPRTAVVALVYVVFLAILISAMIPVVARIAEEAAMLASKLPDLMKQQDPLSHLPLPSWLERARPRLDEVIRERVMALDEEILPILGRAGAQIISGIGNVLSLILIPILSFFFLKDGHAMREEIVEMFDRGYRSLVNGIFSDLHTLLALYIRALVTLALATFIFYFGFFVIVGAPFAILLAGIAAILEVIPVVGPLTASAIILLVVAFTGYQHLLWIVLFLAVYRVFQDYVLSPYLMSSGVELHPMLVLFGVLAGDQLFGIPGMFFSVPAMAALRVILIRLRRRHAAS